MKIEIESLKNGFVVSLANPGELPTKLFVPAWKQVMDCMNNIQVTDGPPQVGDDKTVPLVPPLNDKKGK